MSGRIDILIEAALTPNAKARHEATVRYARGQLVRNEPFAGGTPIAHIYTPTETLEWMDAFAKIAKPRLVEAIAEPVRVDVLAVWPRPLQIVRAARGQRVTDSLLFAVTRSDANNVRACVLDALERAEYFEGARGDRWVVAGEAIGAYAEESGSPRTIVRVRSVRDVDALQHAAALGLISVPPRSGSEWCSECDHPKAPETCLMEDCEARACCARDQLFCCACERALDALGVPR